MSKNSMSLDERLTALGALGDYILEYDDRLKAHTHRAEVSNPWFTQDNIETALKNIATAFLDRQKLHDWVGEYSVSNSAPNTIGLVAAGNIPAVAFHDILCVFITGNKAKVKYSERDKYLIPFLLKVLAEIDSGTAEYFEEVERLSDFDAVIATGGNNSARYFKYYFGKYPNIIRQNKNAAAILTGKESEDDFLRLGNDIFQFFGLGCRSVSHMFLPAGYDFEPLVKALEQFSSIADHNKYKNNLEYHLAIHILNNDRHLALSNLILVEHENLISPVGSLYYNFYEGEEQLVAMLDAHKEDLQCVVAADRYQNVSTLPFGSAQSPGLKDYADGIDTMEFLVQLNNEK